MYGLEILTSFGGLWVTFLFIGWFPEAGSLPSEARKRAMVLPELHMQHYGAGVGRLEETESEEE